ncbi:MAG: hypothetical protein IKM77_02040 [Prevotella sp.]|nr:hypothetical protein [Prevotella sp.]
MNIYSLNPQWLINNALETIITILKVKKVYCFIASDEYNRLNNVELLRWDGADLEDFLNKCVYNFVNMISEPLLCKGEFSGERYVKDLFKESRSLNPIFNIENLDDPNILIIWKPDEQKQAKRDILTTFREYSMNIINKYGNIDYLDRICFYYFDRYLSLSFILKKRLNIYGKMQSMPVPAVIDNIQIRRDPKTGILKEIHENSYDPLLSYLLFKSNDLLEGDSVQERFLTKDGKVQYEKQTINKYHDCLNEEWARYEPDDSGFDRACEAEEEYIIKNGGDSIYD